MPLSQTEPMDENKTIHEVTDFVATQMAIAGLEVDIVTVNDVVATMVRHRKAVGDIIEANEIEDRRAEAV